MFILQYRSIILESQRIQRNSLGASAVENVDMKTPDSASHAARRERFQLDQTN